MTVSFPFLTSAPGKVIIFGEHSAVYNKPSIAAALSLRTYLLVTQDEKDQSYISLEFPDINFSCKWDKKDIPFHLKTNTGNVSPAPTQELNPELVDGLSPLLSSMESPLHYSAAYAFLYLYCSLCNEESQGGLTFTVRSSLPIGAGLGSSASISVCLASAIGYIGGHIQFPTISIDQKITKESSECAFIDSWSFMGEKCIHGNPSGIDNAVATHGGAVMYQRTKDSSNPSVRTSMRNFPPLELLLTNTKVPRSTAVLVGKVSTLVADYPQISNLILDAMESIAREAYNIMLRPFFDPKSKARLFELVRINHGLLVSLGVSHPNLERIKILADDLKVGETKLTGAGGGGCAITLIDSDIDDHDLKLSKLTDALEKEGFEPFQTALGGKGVGMYIPPNNTGLFTVESFKSLSGRNEIEAKVGLTNISEWRFW